MRMIRGQVAPFIYVLTRSQMNISEIKDALQSELVARGCFLVDVSVSKDNDIVVTIESEEGKIELDDCVALSRYFETQFDREKEDYSLTMTSVTVSSQTSTVRTIQAAPTA